MKPRTIAAFLLIGAFLIGCATLQRAASNANAWLANPTNQADIQTAAKVLAAATQLAAPLVTNKTASADLYAAGAVAAAYGSQPVPSNILQATTQAASIATTVTPLVTGKANSATTQAIINGAALILSTAAEAASVPVTTGS